IGPPYFGLDDRELLAHFEAAAQACEPVPFYVYEFAARSGYAVPVAVLRQLRDSVENFVGLKVSDRPWERFEPYLLGGLDVFVGPESLISQGLGAGAAGAVSGLATAFPSEVAAAVRGLPGPDLGSLRKGIEQFPFPAAAKRVLGRRGVPVREDVRAPLRGLTEDERQALDRWLGSLEPAPVPPARRSHTTWQSSVRTTSCSATAARSRAGRRRRRWAVFGSSSRPRRRFGWPRRALASSRSSGRRSSSRSATCSWQRPRLRWPSSRTGPGCTA